MMKNNFKKFNDVLIQVNNVDEQRLPAFAYFNRDINLKHVSLISDNMKKKGYRETCPIIVIKAEDAVNYGIDKLYDLKRDLIQIDDFNSYYLVIEGQHRTYAVSEYNDWLSGQNLDSIEIPAVFAGIKEGESIAEYLNEINATQKEWTKEDYLKGAANLHSDEELLQRYKELIKTDSNPAGFSLSTLNLIFCRNANAINKAGFITLCSGIKNRKKGNAQIIPDGDIETGNEFIKICQAAGFTQTEISKRYIISEFNKLSSIIN
jgi:hypothetical protein